MIEINAVNAAPPDDPASVESQPAKGRHQMPETTETLEPVDQTAPAEEKTPPSLAASETPETAPDDEALGTTVDHVIDTVTNGQQQALETVESASAAIVSSLTVVQRELSDFIAARIRQDMDTQRELMRCKSFADMQVLQSRYVRTAVDQYAAEATRLVRLGSETMTRSLGRR